jgi:glyoxylase-like metal-dependent hydrolase (beta-lactamase superfamily II)
VWSDPDVETIADGVHRIPLPLHDFPGLKAVNVYALEDSSGLSLIDSGADDLISHDSLEAGLKHLGYTLHDVRQVVVTHVHYDHLGQATAISRSTGAEVCLGEGERLSFEQLAFEPERFPVLRTTWLERCGAHEFVLEMIADPDFGPKLVDWDRPGRWINDGDRIGIGDRSLVALATPGHTRGHMSFEDLDRRLLFSGDHVLPHITPSIGFESQRSATALGDFLSSLARVRNLSVDVVLPAHGEVFTDLSGRVDELLAHHEGRLLECLEAIPSAGATAFEVAQRITWTRRRTPYEILRLPDRVLAIWETGAHLELLESQGRLVLDDVDGVASYRPPAPATTA